MENVLENKDKDYLHERTFFKRNSWKSLTEETKLA